MRLTKKGRRGASLPEKLPIERAGSTASIDTAELWAALRAAGGLPVGAGVGGPRWTCRLSCSKVQAMDGCKRPGLPCSAHGHVGGCGNVTAQLPNMVCPSLFSM